jgi:putative transposase
MIWCGTLYHTQVCRFFLNIESISLSLIIYEKNIIERRTIQNIKDRIESFDDYFPCRKEKRMLEHIRKWFNLFVDHHTRK